MSAPPFICNTSIYDIDGNSYSTVQIGAQCWTQNNLKVSKYRNGDAISNIINPTPWSQTSLTNTGAWCHFDNNQSNGITYGKLYNWHAVNDSRGLCPTGWHIPSLSEWNLLIQTVGTNAPGRAMMSITGWPGINTNTNSSGFTALPGGVRGILGNFSNLGSSGYWWSSDIAPQAASRSYLKFLTNSSFLVQQDIFDHVYGLSVRCLKD